MNLIVKYFCSLCFPGFPRVTYTPILEKSPGDSVEEFPGKNNALKCCNLPEVVIRFDDLVYI